MATLPFLVEAWGPAADCHYVVSKVSDRKLVQESRFEPGVTLEFWNGVPFARAVDIHADTETGGRPDARQARALDSLPFGLSNMARLRMNIGWTSATSISKEATGNPVALASGLSRSRSHRQPRWLSTHAPWHRSRCGSCTPGKEADV